MLIVLRRRGLHWGRVFDIGCVVVPLAQAIGRVGCHLGGCCWGKVTSSWLAMRLPDGHGIVATRFPTQLLSAAADLLIFSTLLGFEQMQRRRGREGRPFEGFVAMLFVQLYCSKRLFMEILRDTAPPLLGPLTWAQLACVAGLLIAATGMIRRMSSGRSGRSNDHSDS